LYLRITASATEPRKRVSRCWKCKPNATTRFSSVPQY